MTAEQTIETEILDKKIFWCHILRDQPRENQKPYIMAAHAYDVIDDEMADFLIKLFCLESI